MAKRVRRSPKGEDGLHSSEAQAIERKMPVDRAFKGLSQLQNLV
jgi:hypothetical protein